MSKFTSLQFSERQCSDVTAHVPKVCVCSWSSVDLSEFLLFFRFVMCRVSSVVCRVDPPSCSPLLLLFFVTSMLFAIAPGMSLVSTFAGQHTPNNSSIMPGMGLNRDKNSYLYPEYQVLFCAMPPVYVVCLHSAVWASLSAGLARPHRATSKYTGRAVVNANTSVESSVSCQSSLWRNFERIST